MSNWWRTAGGTLKLAAGAAMPKERFYHTIQAIPREVKGSRMSARDRAQGRIPTVVFSQSYIQKTPGDPTSLVADSSVSRKRLLTTEKKQIKAILKSVGLPSFFSATYPLQIRAGSGSSTLLESGNVLPLKVHTDEEGRILNMVFAWAEEGKEFKVDVPVVFKGEDACPGVLKGGQLKKIRTSIKYLCPVEHIPPKIEVDLSNLDIGDKVLMQDIKVHPTMKLLSKYMEMPVCKVQAIWVDDVEEPSKKSELNVE